MIVVTGGTGQLGRGVVEHLLSRVPAEQVAVSVRDPEKAADLAGRGVQVRRGDFAEPATLVDAFAGASRLLLISTDVVGPLRRELQRNAVAAARAAGVGHILYTSIADADPQSPFSGAADHVDTEEAIRESGLRYTLLRNTFYMDMLPALTQGAAAGVVAGPADGPGAYATRADLAEGTANLLAAGGYENQAVELTGGVAVDLAQAAQIVAGILGRPVERVVLPDEVYREQLIGFGFPPEGAAAFLQVFAALREGRFARVSPVLGDLLGRAPVTPQQFLERALAAA